MDKRIFLILAFVLFSFTFVRYSVCQQDTSTIKPPQLIFVPINPGGQDFSLNTIQNNVGYRVEILYDHPERLDIKFTGPVIIKQISTTVYEVNLKLLNSEAEFDEWIKSKDAPYLASFTVSVKDAATSLTLNSSALFTFGKW